MKANWVWKLLVIVIITLASTTSCDDELVEIHSSIIGEVISTPSTVKNGQVITLSIGGNIVSSSSMSVNGREYYPVIHYNIDGQKIVTSAEKSLPYNAEYTVRDLSIGEHTLTVTITGAGKRTIYENKITSSKLYVTE